MKLTLKPKGQRTAIVALSVFIALLLLVGGYLIYTIYPAYESANQLESLSCSRYLSLQQYAQEKVFVKLYDNTYDSVPPYNTPLPDSETLQSYAAALDTICQQSSPSNPQIGSELQPALQHTIPIPTGSSGGHVTIDEPIIYLYPTTTEPVTVKLGFKGTLTTTYPTYNSSTGWQVIAHPDGTLTNEADGLSYSYLFWEGKYNLRLNENSGFVVKGSDTATFLRQSLSKLGLTPTEYNDFIVYWLPKMEANPI